MTQYPIAMTDPSSRTHATLALAVLIGMISAAPMDAAQVATGTSSASQPGPNERDLISPDRPGIADGSGVIARGLVQVEIGFQREFRQDAGRRTRTSFLPALLRIGLAARWEGRLETNAYNWTDAEGTNGTGDRSGWSPVSLGIKYQINSADSSRWPSLAVIGRIFPPSGSGAFGSQRLTGDLRLVADLDVSRTVSLNPNVGFARYEDEAEAFTATLLAVTLTFMPSARVTPFIDLGFQKPVEINGPGSLVIDGGLAYIISRNVQLDVSLGTGVRGPAPRLFFSFGISFRSSRKGG